jgi:hypothetical protein
MNSAMEPTMKHLVFRPMLSRATLAAAIAICSAASAAAADQAALDSLPRALEVKLALSALPAHLRPEATIFVLDPKSGYIVERQGSNGFTCFVERTDYVRAQYRDDLLVPICFDPEGTRTIEPVSFDVARIRAEGKLSAQELKAVIVQRFKDGVYRSPSRPGISYMIAPVMRLYMGPDSKDIATMNMPHYMFYAPNLTKADFGGGRTFGSHPYLANPGPHAYMILHVGAAETAEINRENQDLLHEICAYRAIYCLDDRSSAHDNASMSTPGQTHR